MFHFNFHLAFYFSFRGRFSTFNLHYSIRTASIIHLLLTTTCYDRVISNVEKKSDCFLF